MTALRLCSDCNRTCTPLQPRQDAVGKHAHTEISLHTPIPISPLRSHLTRRMCIASKMSPRSILCCCSNGTSAGPNNGIFRFRLVSSHSTKGREARIPIFAQLKEAVVDDAADGRRIVSLSIRHARADAKDGTARHTSSERARASFVSPGALGIANHLGFGVVPRLELEQRVASFAFVSGAGLTEHQSVPMRC